MQRSEQSALSEHRIDLVYENRVRRRFGASGDHFPASLNHDAPESFLGNFFHSPDWLRGLRKPEIEIALRAAKRLHHRFGGDLTQRLMMNVFVVESSKHPSVYGSVAHFERWVVKSECEIALRSQRAIETLEAAI